MYQIWDDLPNPSLMRQGSYNRDPSKQCAYHNDVGNNTEFYWALKKEIQKLIDRGHLDKFKCDRPTRPTQPARMNNVPFVRGVINIILEEEPSITQIRRNIYSLSKLVDSPTFLQVGEEPLQFTQSELTNTDLVAEQTLVISSIIYYYQVYQILVNIGSYRNILYYSYF